MFKKNYIHVFPAAGADTDHVKVAISQDVKLCNLYKTGKYGKKIGENRENYHQKSGKIETFT